MALQPRLAIIGIYAEVTVMLLSTLAATLIAQHSSIQ